MLGWVISSHDKTSIPAKITPGPAPLVKGGVGRLPELEVGERLHQAPDHPERLGLWGVQGHGIAGHHKDRQLPVDGADPSEEAGPVHLPHLDAYHQQIGPRPDVGEALRGILREHRNEAHLGHHLGDQVPDLHRLID